MQVDIHASNGIRTHDPSILAVEAGKQSCYRRIDYYVKKPKLQVNFWNRKAY
jgi:hypothetical protein